MSSYTRNMRNIDAKIAQFTTYRRIVEDATIELGDSRARLGEWKEKMKKLLAEKDEMYQSVRDNIHYLRDATYGLQAAANNITKIDIKHIDNERAGRVQAIKSICVDGVTQRVSQIVEKAENDVRDQNNTTVEFQAHKCAICLSQKIEVAIDDCGHILCHSCANKCRAQNKKCPFCRKEIEKIIKIYYVM